MISGFLPGAKGVSGLRTRYFPKSRIGQGIITMSPWLDVMLLIVLFVLLGHEVVLKPGIVIDLPRAPFSGGTRPGLVVVVRVLGGESTHRVMEEEVFFDDVGYRIADEDQRASLESALVRQAGRRKKIDLIVYADQRVKHGTLMMLYEMASTAGIGRVNVAVKEERDSGGLRQE